MPFQIILSTPALKELESAMDWYEAREAGLGKRFVDVVDKRLHLLSETPDIFPIKPSGYNEVSVNNFPYVIIYKILPKAKKVHILHVFHTKRNPANKSTKLD